MSPSQVVLAFVNAMVRRDWPAAMALIDADIVYANMPLPVLHGARRFDAFLGPWVKDHDEISILVQTLVEQQGCVVLERLDRSRTRAGEWEEMSAVGLFTIRDGLITEWRDYYDLERYCRMKGLQYDDVVAGCRSLAEAHLISTA